MNRPIRIGLAAALVALGGCGEIEPKLGPAVQSGSADFGIYVAMGTSLGAGYSNGGTVESHQRHSYPYLFAQQVGAPFTIPSISDSGLGPLLVLRSYSPLLITRAATPGSPTNFGQPTSYHNMSIPGALLVDVLDSTAVGYSRGLFPVIQRHRGLILQQAIGLHPTFVSFEYGANEVLGAAVAGSGTVNPAFQPANFAALYGLALNGLSLGAPQAKLVLFNVPEVTSIPFFTTLPAFTVGMSTGSPVPLVGVDGNLAPGDLVLLDPGGPLICQGYGVPAGGYNYVCPQTPGNGQPLPESAILRAQEVADLRTVVTAYNSAIRAEATSRNAALVDLNELLHRIATEGIHYGSVVYTSEFITGGVFGLDGVHPTDLGYAIMANAMIDAVNAKFGSSIRHVDLGTVATRGRYAADITREGPLTKPLVLGLDQVLRELYARPGAAMP
jgi:GDSL-like lipase/acylhydrolase family protein